MQATYGNKNCSHSLFSMIAREAGALGLSEAKEQSDRVCALIIQYAKFHYSVNIFQFKKKSPKSKVVAIFKTLLKSSLWATGSFKCIIHFWGTWCGE